VDFKILVHAYKALHDQSPIYVKDLLELYQPARNLRFQNSKQLVVPKSRTVRYGDQRFSSVAPKLWNALPVTIRDDKSLDVFKRSLKTNFFVKIYEN
jgi:hypothetical protein